MDTMPTIIPMYLQAEHRNMPGLIFLLLVRLSPVQVEQMIPMLFLPCPSILFFMDLRAIY
jgi:hypothetical protein